MRNNLPFQDMLIHSPTNTISQFNFVLWKIPKSSAWKYELLNDKNSFCCMWSIFDSCNRMRFAVNVAEIVCNSLLSKKKKTSNSLIVRKRQKAAQHRNITAHQIWIVMSVSLALRSEKYERQYIVWKCAPYEINLWLAFDYCGSNYHVHHYTPKNAILYVYNTYSIGCIHFIRSASYSLCIWERDDTTFSATVMYICCCDDYDHT